MISIGAALLMCPWMREPFKYYGHEVSESQVRKIDELFREEFERGDWITEERI